MEGNRTRRYHRQTVKRMIRAIQKCENYAERLSSLYISRPDLVRLSTKMEWVEFWLADSRREMEGILKSV